MSTPPDVFQRLSTEIEQQELIVQQLKARFEQDEAASAEKRRQDAIISDRQRLTAEWGALTQQLNNLNARMEKAKSLIQDMQRSIDVLLPERNNLLQQLAAVKLQLNANGSEVN